MKWKGNMVVGRRPVSLRETYSDDQIVEHIASAETRIAELEAALMELRQSLIGGVEGVKAGRDLTKWAAANERLLAKRKK